MRLNREEPTVTSHLGAPLFKVTSIRGAEVRPRTILEKTRGRMSKFVRLGIRSCSTMVKDMKMVVKLKSLTGMKGKG